MASSSIKSNTTEYTLQSTWACLPSVTRGERVILSADHLSKNFTYCNGLCVIIRDIKNPEIAKTYTGHKCAATVARFSPSGHYIASGDERGKVQIWAPDHETMMMKHEYPVLGGRVRDIAWDSESKRLIAVGEGRDKFGHAFSMDTGTTVGAITEHFKTANSVSIRQTRPIRAATGSDDMNVNIHTGVPFKLLRAVRGEHTRFVSCVAFSPDNNTLASAALDGKVIFYDAVEGTTKAQIPIAHKGGIYGLSWSPDSRKILTSSADCTVKLWDVETSTAVVTWEMGNRIEDQQLGNLWAGEYMMSVSLSAQIKYLNEKTGKVQRVIDGHQRSVGSLLYDNKSRTLFSGSLDGRICSWDESQMAVPFEGSTHSASISEIKHSGENTAISIGSDCRLCKLDLKSKTASTLSTIPDIPKSVVVSSDGTIFVGTTAGLIVSKPKSNGEFLQITRNDIKGCESLAISKDEKVLAVAGESSGIVKLFDLPLFEQILDSNNPTKIIVAVPKQTITTRIQGVSRLEYSTNGLSLAVAGITGIIYLHCTKTGDQTHEFGGHASRVTSMAFSYSGNYIVSSGVDSQVIAWNIENKLSRRAIRNAHHGTVSSVVFEGESDNIVISSGSDGCIKKWKIEKLPGIN